MGYVSTAFPADTAAIDQPLHMVLICGEIVVFAGEHEFLLTPSAAEETSRRLASIAAVARTETQR